MRGRWRRGLLVAALVTGAATLVSVARAGDERPQVWPAKATRMRLANEGGAQPRRGDPTCKPYTGSYTLTVADRRLAWHACMQRRAGRRASSFALIDGRRTLTREQLGEVVAALRAVELSTRDIKTADVPTLSLSVTTPAGLKDYVDVTSSVRERGVPVQNLGPLLNLVVSLAGR